MLDAQQMARLFEAIVLEEERFGGSAVACAAIRLAFWTGWRIGEVLALEWSNLDLDRGVAQLVRTKTAAEEYRQVPTEGLILISGLMRIAGCRFVFPGRDLRNHLTHVRKPWDRIRKRAGLGDLAGLGAFRLHDLRHTS
jgi:integrase